MKHRWFSMTLVATALASIAVGSAITIATHDNHHAQAFDALGGRDIPDPPPAALEHAENLSGAFKHASQVISPAVVSIRSTKVLKANGPNMRRGPSPQLPEEFRDFFNDDFFEKFGSPRSFGIPQSGEMRQQGQGTGVIISKDGYVVTNNHVVDGADEVQVQLVDRRKFDAKVIGTDAKTDVAVLKIEASDLTPAAIGNSDQIAVGDWVVAVGSPFGLQHTVTAGIVSAKGRADVGIVEYEDFIQTDAAINPGNSGGPLVNLRGEVVGINTAIASRSGSFAGVGFSIPINMVQSVVGDILDDGKVERGWLGAAIQNLNSDLAASFNYDSTDGVLVGQVVPGSPAEKAGLQAGDIVVELNGRQQLNANGLRNQVARIKPETSVPLVVMRDGNRVTLNVEIGLLDEKQLARASAPAAGNNADEVSTDLGVTVRTLTPELAKQFGLSDTAAGVVVTDVAADSVAAGTGISPGDIIVNVDGTTVKSSDEFEAAIADVDLTRGVRLLVSSDGFQRFVFLRQR